MLKASSGRMAIESWFAGVSLEMSSSFALGNAACRRLRISCGVSISFIPHEGGRGPNRRIVSGFQIVLAKVRDGKFPWHVCAQMRRALRSGEPLVRDFALQRHDRV